MASAISANKAELLAIANSVATEKMIDKAIVLEAMEEAIQRAAREAAGQHSAADVTRAVIDPGLQEGRANLGAPPRAG